MKTSTPSPLFKCIASLPALAALTLMYAAPVSAHAAVILLNTTDASGQNSFGNSSGTGLSPASPGSNWAGGGNISSADDYVVASGRILRTIAGGGSETFFGNSLTIGDGSTAGTLGLKQGSAATFTVNNLKLDNGTVTQASDGLFPATLAGNLTILGGGGTFTTGGSASRTLTLTASLAGSGNLLINDVGNFVLAPSSATSFTGTLNLSKGAIDFNTDIVSGGALTINSTGVTIVLDQNLTFNGLTIAGDVLANGFYSFTTLNTSYDSIFVNGGTGSITVVPEPTTWMLLGCTLTVTVLLRRRHKAA